MPVMDEAKLDSWAARLLIGDIDEVVGEIQDWLEYELPNIAQVEALCEGMIEAYPYEQVKKVFAKVKSYAWQITAFDFLLERWRARLSWSKELTSKAAVAMFVEYGTSPRYRVSCGADLSASGAHVYYYDPAPEHSVHEGSVVRWPKADDEASWDAWAERLERELSKVDDVLEERDEKGWRRGART